MSRIHLFAVLASVPVLAGCGIFADRDRRDVTYRATGTVSAVSINYWLPDSVHRSFGQSLPWSCDFSARRGDLVCISAASEGDTGSLTVAIVVDDSLWRGATSYGGPVGTTAQGLLP